MLFQLNKDGSLCLSKDYGELSAELDPSKKRMKLSPWTIEQSSIEGWIAVNLLENY